MLMMMMVVMMMKMMMVMMMMVMMVTEWTPPPCMLLLHATDSYVAKHICGCPQGGYIYVTNYNVAKVDNVLYCNLQGGQCLWAEPVVGA